jgi:hypothetical protein
MNEQKNTTKAEAFCHHEGKRGERHIKFSPEKILKQTVSTYQSMIQKLDNDSRLSFDLSEILKVHSYRGSSMFFKDKCEALSQSFLGNHNMYARRMDKSRSILKGLEKVLESEGRLPETDS